MPETDVIPTSASVASTGLGIRYIGDYAYCLSGTFDANTNQQTVLDFTSGAGFIRAEFLSLNLQEKIALVVPKALSQL